MTARFKRGDLVKFVRPIYRTGLCVGTGIVTATIEAECNGRPGWFYARELSGETHLVLGSDLNSASE